MREPALNSEGLGSDIDANRHIDWADALLMREQTLPSLKPSASAENWGKFSTCHLKVA
jgi:hypothetical protein